MLLLVGAALVRIGWVLHLPVDESALRVLPDQVEYLQLGRNLLHNHSLEFYDERFDSTVRAYRTPGYPLLVAMCGANLTIVRLVQALLDTSTVLAAWFLARRWLSPGAGNIACIVLRSIYVLLSLRFQSSRRALRKTRAGNRRSAFGCRC